MYKLLILLCITEGIGLFVREGYTQVHVKNRSALGVQSMNLLENTLVRPSASAENLKNGKCPLNGVQAIQSQKEQKLSSGQQQLLSIPYTQTELLKKYPKIDCSRPPGDQLMTADYAQDSADNYKIAEKVLKFSPEFSLSDSNKNALITLENIHFSGPNVYLKIRLKNQNTKKDFLTGAMMVYWKSMNSPVKELWASCVNAFPVLLPGNNISLIYAFHAVNAKDDDLVVFELKDRIKKQVLQINIPGKLYNAVMNRMEKKESKFKKRKGKA